MKMCQTHWDKLKAAIEARGLGGFVAKDGVELGKKVEADGFEPLLAAHNAILHNIFGVAGAHLLVAEQEAERRGEELCSLCWASAQHRAVCKDGNAQCDHFEKWIDLAADGQLEIAKERGLVAGA